MTNRIPLFFLLIRLTLLLSLPGEFRVYESPDIASGRSDGALTRGAGFDAIRVDREHTRGGPAGVDP